MNAIVTNTTRELMLDSMKKLFTSNTYVMLSRSEIWPDDNAPPDADRSELEKTEAWRQSFFFKKIKSSDVAFMIKRIDWTSGDVYDMYNTSEDLTNKDFFVITNQQKVYKCLDNNQGGPSTVKPTLILDTAFTTADGYKWKYMFTVADSVMDKFSTTELVPIQANTSIEEAAVSGTINTILIKNSGNNWIAIHSGSVTEVISNSTFRISNSAETSNDYYTSSGFYINGGAGSGYISQITDYISNSSGNYVSVADANSSINFGSTYEISPYVKIIGDGSGAKAYSTVDANNDTVSKITVLSNGSDYTWAEANLVAKINYSNTESSITPLVSPIGGHGARPISELYSNSFCVSVIVSNTNGLQTNVNCRTVGILSVPKNNIDETVAQQDFYVQSTQIQIDPVVGAFNGIQQGELLTGLTSKTKAIVLTTNATYVHAVNLTSSFVVGETIVTNTTQSSFVANSITGAPLKYFSGNTLYISNIQPINIDVSGASKEIVKLIIGV